MRPRKQLETISLPAHGGIDYAELERLGIIPEDVLDFSASVNPWGAPPSIGKAIAGLNVSRYPDSECMKLRRALGQMLDLPAENIIAGNGSSELIWLAALAFLDPGDRALIVGPTFEEYERAVLLCGAQPVFYRSRADDDFLPELPEISRLLALHRPKVVFLCNPNNPTGTYLDRESVGLMLEAAPDSLLVLDEAYLSFLDEQHWRSSDLIPRGILVLRSMTKDFGLAGLRLGYAFGNQSTIAALRKARPPWSVNAVAQAAGIACLGEECFVTEAKARLCESRDFLMDSLRTSGLRVVPSRANFFLLEVGNATEVRAAVLQQGLLLRDCSSFGLPSFLRIAARPLADCVRLVSAMRAVLDSKGLVS